VRPEGLCIQRIGHVFPCRTYTDSNRCNTLKSEWSIARCCHLVVCLVALMDGLEDGYGYNYHSYALIIMLITLMMLDLCML
jgi:hypothetical protein